MTIFGLLLAIYLTYRIVREKERLTELERELRLRIQDEEEFEEERRVWWMFWGDSHQREGGLN